jgi:hypothetical protein
MLEAILNSWRQSTARPEEAPCRGEKGITYSDKCSALVNTAMNLSVL